MSDHAIVFEGLTHWYGATLALDTLDLAVPRGSVFALLGRNGAGKTTALSCLLGMQRPTRGRALLFGEDSTRLTAETRGRVGYVSEGQTTVPWMRIDDLIGYQAAGFPGFDRDLCHEHLARLGLPRDRRVKSLSRGQQAQVALALALAPRPELLILDDPASGLDAVVRREFLEAMIELITEEGNTLFFTSHILQDVERIADRVAILDGGVLRVCGPLDEIRERIQRIDAVFPGEPPATGDIPGVVRRRRFDNHLNLTVAGDVEAATASLRKLGAERVEVTGLSLEDLFIDYMAGSPLVATGNGGAA